jgi:hypothetical protein
MTEKFDVLTRHRHFAPVTQTTPRRRTRTMRASLKRGCCGSTAEPVCKCSDQGKTENHVVERAEFCACPQWPKRETFSIGQQFGMRHTGKSFLSSGKKQPRRRQKLHHYCLVNEENSTKYAGKSAPLECGTALARRVFDRGALWIDGLP